MPANLGQLQGQTTGISQKSTLASFYLEGGQRS
jgi:hypothetical protein